MPACDLNGEDKHVCMLPQEPKYYDLPPTAGCMRHLLYKIREQNLACSWHVGTLLFYRSRRRLAAERERQARGSWFVRHPYSPAKYYWDCIGFALMYASFIYMPIQVFFDCPDPYDPFVFLCDAFAFLDICTKFITGKENTESSKITLDPKVIAKEYLTGMFVFDVISALPLQCIQFQVQKCEYPTHTVWFVMKLFRIVSLQNQWHNLSRQMRLSYVASSVITACGRSVLFYHWVTYIYYQVPTICAHYYSNDNLKARNWFKRLLIKTNDTFITKYTENLYYVCGLCNGVGNFMPLHGVLLPELILNSVLGIVGLCFMTYTFTTLLRLATYTRSDIFLYNGRLKEITDYMLFKGLPKALEHKIRLFLNYKFYEHYFNEKAIMNTINEQIKQDINMHCCKKLVMSVPLFQDMPIALINTIIFGLTRVLFMPGEVVVRCEQPGESIYLISSGTVAVINSAGREIAHLRDGAHFGESALLNPGVLRSATIIALEITEMYKLSSSAFASCLQPHPHLKRRLDDVAARRAAPGKPARRH